MVALLTFLPSIVAALVLGLAYAFDYPVSIERVGWLISDAQALFLALGAATLILAKKSSRPLPSWRTTANRWVGRVMAAFGIFYLIAFALVTYRAP